MKLTVKDLEVWMKEANLEPKIIEPTIDDPFSGVEVSFKDLTIGEWPITLVMKVLPFDQTPYIEPNMKGSLLVCHLEFPWTVKAKALADTLHLLNKLNETSWSGHYYFSETREKVEFCYTIPITKKKSDELLLHTILNLCLESATIFGDAVHDIVKGLKDYKTLMSEAHRAQLFERVHENYRI